MAESKPRVLVMDDEDAVRRVAQLFLARLGCEPVTVASGKAAVLAYREAQAAGKSFVAVILDLTVPEGMGGLAAAREILALDAQARLVVTSGNPHDEVVEDHLQHGFCGVIRKPFDLKTFSQAMAAVLAGRGEGLTAAGDRG